MTNAPEYRILRDVVLSLPARPSFAPVTVSLQLPTISTVEIDDTDVASRTQVSVPSAATAPDELAAVTRYVPGAQWPLGGRDELVRVSLPLRAGEAVPGRLEWWGHLSAVSGPKATLGTAARCALKVTVASRIVWIRGLPPVSQPQNLDATASVQDGDRRITLDWTPVEGATSYEIWRGLASGIEVLLTTTTMTSFLDQGLDRGRIYYYFIIATNAGSRSLPSAEAGAETRPNVRPSNAMLNSLGAGKCHSYFPLDRIVAHDSDNSFVSIDGTGAMFGKWTAADEPTAVDGFYDWAQSQATGVISLDTLGFGGANPYPTGAPWTWSYSMKFRQLVVGQNFDICWKNFGGNSQFLMRCTAGSLGVDGYSNQNGYLFPINDSPTYGLQHCGSVPDDLLDHTVQITLTNDPTASGGGGVLKVWVDGVLQGTFVGRPGCYLGAVNARNSLGGLNATGDGNQHIAISDVGEWNDDFEDTDLQAALL